MTTRLLSGLSLTASNPLPQKAKMMTAARVRRPKKTRNRGPKKRSQKMAPSRGVLLFGYTSRGAGKWPHFSCSGITQKVKNSFLPRLPAWRRKLNKDLSIENQVNENKASLTRSTFFMISCFDQWMTWHEIDERSCVQMLIKRIMDDRPWNPRNPNSMLRKKKSYHCSA